MKPTANEAKALLWVIQSLTEFQYNVSRCTKAKVSRSGELRVYDDSNEGWLLVTDRTKLRTRNGHQFRLPPPGWDSKPGNAGMNADVAARYVAKLTGPELLAVYAQGLDASAPGGTGWGAEHEAVRKILEAAQELRAFACACQSNPAVAVAIAHAGISIPEIAKEGRA